MITYVCQSVEKDWCKCSIRQTFTAARTTLPLTCWNCGTTRSHMCSLSCSSAATYLANAFNIATRPHSEHSFRAIRSLFRIVVVMVNMPGSEDDVEGCDVAAIWMSVRAAMVLATTFATFR